MEKLVYLVSIGTSSCGLKIVIGFLALSQVSNI